MQKLLIISSVWVEPNSSAAGSRMLQLIAYFLSKNYNITYASTAAKSDFSIDLTLKGISIKNIKINDSEFDVFIENLNPQIVLFDRFITEEQFGWKIAEILPNTLRILDTEDLHFLRKTREIAIKNNKTFKETDCLKQEITKREIASVLRCDLSLIISTYELDLLQNLFKIDENILHYIPFLLDNLSVKEINRTPMFEDRKHFYFVGNFLHKPNSNVIQYLKKEIWPKISKKLPNAELHIYGAYMPEKIKQLHNKKERFIIKGRAESLNNSIQNSKICLAPLLFGAGIKGKFIEAMQNGTPSITTTIGAEAMHKELGWSGIISDDSDGIINASIELYTNKTLWLVAQQNGIKIINKCYDKTELSNKLAQKINIILNDLEKHREQNFLGELLQHHTLRSTKYLSKWIEEKNKLQSKTNT